MNEYYENLINRVKKGSKIFRNILSKKHNVSVPHNIVKYSSNTDTVIGYELSKKLNRLWTSSFLSTSTKTFCFKLYNNVLPFNHVLSHFVRGQSRNCTFCDIIGNAEEEDETPLHIFYSCSVSENIINDFFNFIGTVITRQEFFTVPERDNVFTNKILTLLCILIKKIFWDNKLNNCCPDPFFLQNFIKYEIRVICNINSEMREALLRCNLSK
jgi:hypothetical protein